MIFQEQYEISYRNVITLFWSRFFLSARRSWRLHVNHLASHFAAKSKPVQRLTGNSNQLEL